MNEKRLQFWLQIKYFLLKRQSLSLDVFLHICRRNMIVRWWHHHSSSCLHASSRVVWSLNSIMKYIGYWPDGGGDREGPETVLWGGDIVREFLGKGTRERTRGRVGKEGEGAKEKLKGEKGRGREDGKVEGRGAEEELRGGEGGRGGAWGSWGLSQSGTSPFCLLGKRRKLILFPGTRDRTQTRLVRW